MKLRTVNFLVCPECREKLNLTNIKKEIIDKKYSVHIDNKCRKCIFKKKYECSECMSLEVKEGKLNCENGHIFYVVDYVPRMLPSQNLSDAKKHFGNQWKHWGSEEKIFGKTEEQMLDLCISHATPQSVDKDYFKNLLILDAGCGHGKYALGFARLGNETIGMDITSQVEKNYKMYSKDYPLLQFVQGDVLKPPFKEKTFDYVYSRGVIHHTGDTIKAFKEVFALVKSKGIFGLWVYPYRSAIFEFTTKFLRFFTTRIPKKLLFILSYIPVPLLSIIPAYSGTSLKNSSWNQCAQVVFDFFGPRYQTHHKEEEVKSWFLNEGVDKIEFFRDHPISAAAVKK